MKISAIVNLQLSKHTCIHAGKKAESQSTD